MKLKAFDDSEQLEEYCENIDPNDLRKVIQDGYEEYGYKADENECAFSRDELNQMSEILEDRF